MHNIKYSGYADKAVIHKKDSNEAAQEFADNSLDFIFIDTYLTPQQAYNDLEVWYSKVKTGGIFAGHDYDCPDIQDAISLFRHNYSVTNRLSVYDNTWVWIK